MNPKAAEQAVRLHLAASLDVRLVCDPPEGLYGFDPEQEFLFAVGGRHSQVGGVEYLAVSKRTGAVRKAGGGE